MFNKKFTVLLTTIHVWMIAVSAVIFTAYAIWDASSIYDFAGSVGYFSGMMLVGFIYLSIWYLAIYLIRKSILK